MSKQDIEKRLGFAAQGVKAEMAASFEDRQRAAGYKWQVRYTKQLGKTDYHNAMEIDETLAFATESAARKWADTMIKKGWYKGISGTPEKVLTAKVVPFARPGAKAKMALTIYTVGAKNACYEALANLGVLAKLASDTKSGWDFHVTAIIDHVKSAMSQLESSPAQAGEYLSRAIDTLGMLRKIDPVRLNDIQKGSLKQLIGYVAKSLRDARANIKVVTTASRPGVKAKMGRAEKVLSDGSVSLDFTEAKEWLSTVSDEALKYIISDSNAAAKAMGSGGKKFNYYTDLALTAAQMLRSTKRGGHRLNSSRPSAKAKMENSDGNYFMISGYVDNSILGNRTFDTQAEAEYYGKRMLESLKKDNPKAKDVNVQISKVIKYSPQTPFKTLSLRPGVKAKA